MSHPSARMKTKGGDVRFVPFWQIEFWQKKGIFDELDYTFEDEIGPKEYEEWLEKKAKAAAIAEAKKGSGPTIADGGIADAHMSVGGRSTSEAIVPDGSGDVPPETEGEDGDGVAAVAEPFDDDIDVKEVV